MREVGTGMTDTTVPQYTAEERKALVDQQVAGLEAGTIAAEFSYKEIIEEPEVKQQYLLMSFLKRDLSLLLRATTKNLNSLRTMPER